MSLSICSAVCGAVDVTEQWIVETLGSCSKPREVCIAYNGCTQNEVDVLSRQVLSKASRAPFCVSKDPQGSAEALNDAVTQATGRVVAILHNDLMIRQPGWDLALLEFFDQHPEAGLVGFAGAKQLGRPGIYQTPYELTQLARADVWTSLEDWEMHGKHATEPVEVAVLDGLAICAKTSVWRLLGGFNLELGVHHMYDNDLALRALEAGFKNYVIPVVCRHLNGQTANADRYQQKFGPDSEVHRVAHERFYAAWRNRLPVRVA